MPAGIEVVNSFGVTQITDKTSNFALASKGETVTGSPPYYNIIGYNPVEESLFFFRPKNAPRPGVGGGLASTVGVNLAMGQFQFQWTSAYWWRFSISKYVAASSEGVGLQVFDEFGNLAFDSSQKVLKIIAAYDVPRFDQFIPGPDFGVRTNWIPLPHNNVAICLVNPCIQYMGLLPGRPAWFADAIEYDYANTRFRIRLDTVVNVASPTAFYVVQPHPYKVLVTDVTGL